MNVSGSNPTKEGEPYFYERTKRLAEILNNISS